MKLKTRKRGDDRPSTICSASRCKAVSTIILATGKLDDCDVHLCDRHWEQHCDETEAEAERIEAEKLLAKIRCPKLKAPPGGLKPGRYKFRYTDDLDLEVIP